MPVHRKHTFSSKKGKIQKKGKVMQMEKIK